MPDVLGFIGLGAMGRPICERLLAHGHQVVVFDARQEAIDTLVELGARAAASPAEVANAAETVFLSLPQPSIVQSVVEGNDGVLRGAAIRLLVDLSTTGPETAERIRLATAARSVAYVDAPVSGGPAGARDGKLSVMVAGASDAIAALEPYLDVLAGRVTRVGDTPGQAQLAKVLNNLISACSIVITAEALTMGARAGLEPSTLIDVFNASSGRTTASEVKFPKHVLTRQFDFGFGLNLMLKDVSLAMSEAARLGSPMVLGSVVQQLWSIGAATLPADSDCTEIVRLYEDWAAVTLAETTTSSA
jgi:3-hydroxyisobutyrate dehydrogenase-like beta-hydroxyacid dehydrogenase